MPLPPTFQLSQSSLQDYVECARRFELRYVQELAWPAVEAEPIAEYERHMRQGDAFHRLVHQHLIGIPAAHLTPLAADAPLEGWWAHYLHSGLDGLPERRWPEITLTAPLAGRRLIAKYDLIALEPGTRAVIVDWKTSLKRPGRERLAGRLQTIVYRYVLARAGLHLNGGPAIPPQQIEMIYWFAEYPTQPERFVYDSAQFQADETTLAALIAEIEGRTTFELTADLSRCKFCAYRSLCRRGVQAGDFAVMDSDVDDEGDLDFDFDQIAEIEF